MKKPDRFERDAHRAVQQLMDGDVLDLTAASLTMVHGAESVIRALLLRQHRAYVRIGKSIMHSLKVTEGGGGEWVLRKDILGAFAAYKKGQP